MIETGRPSLLSTTPTPITMIEGTQTNSRDISAPVPESMVTRPPRPWKPNYNQIHARPMPLNVYPLPFFAPHNPLSWVQIIYAIVKDRFYPRDSHPSNLCQGYFDEATRSVHVTDPTTVRALWEQGFFGKGLLSRSEPTWLNGERKRLGIDDSLTAEEITSRRRKDRERFKKERARLEREALEQQKQKEAGRLNGAIIDGSKGKTTVREDSAFDDQVKIGANSVENAVPDMIGSQREANEHQQSSTANGSTQANSPEVQGGIPAALVNQEHLQLSREEAFYLSYALGSLAVTDPNTNTPITAQTSLLQLFRSHSYFPPASPSSPRPDDRFLLSYVVYHHFRSLGWVVRDGIKFAVDYLLYQRGPAFTHAAFAIVIIPSYTHAYWFQTPERKQDVERKKAKYSWHWLHCINRVQSQVVKTLVLVYVDVPPPAAIEMDLGGAEGAGGGIGAFLGRYKVREFCVQRWSPNRNRALEGQK
jgi:tRNA-splicing endonuclease subunit Sen2